MEILNYFQKNNQLFGGFRGIYKSSFVKNGYNFNHINDLGLLPDILLEEIELIKYIYNINEDNISINKDRK